MTAWRFRDAKYCSKSCSNSATKRNRVQKICSWCNSKFEVIKFRDGTAQYCSYECFNLNRRQGIEDDVEIVCENCGTKRSVPFIHRLKRFCNNSCASSGKFNAFYGVTGQDHPM